MLALSAFHALRDAVASVTGYTQCPRLDAPATDERILAAVDEIRKRSVESANVVSVGVP